VPPYLNDDLRTVEQLCLAGVIHASKRSGHIGRILEVQRLGQVAQILCDTAASASSSLPDDQPVRGRTALDIASREQRLEWIGIGHFLLDDFSRLAL
jgi:hypothetical protein